MFHIGLENGTEGRSQAWVLGHPGCFAYGKDGSAALATIPEAIQAYRLWIAAHTNTPWLVETDNEYQLDETWECYSINSDFELSQEGYEVNAWFRHDWKPLTDEEIQHGLLLLAWGRDELLKVVDQLTIEALERAHTGERWSISGILKHIGGAEWWYLDRLGLAFPRQEVPDDPFQRLEKVRSYLLNILPGLSGSTQVAGISGEFWSPRKLLRRAVWHERDHISHIRKLL
jgi:uncharacterized damage-inducible protein DinB